MIYYCYDCQFTEEINDKDIALGKIQVPEICPKCKSINVSLRHDSTPQILKSIAWWIFVAPLGSFPFLILVGIAEPLEQTHEILFNLLMFTALIGMIGGWILGGFAPKLIKKYLNKNRQIEATEALNRKNYKKAAQKYTEILSSNPLDATIYVERGKAYLLDQQIALATNDFICATLLAPGNMEYKYYRTTVFMYYMDDEAYNIAIEHFSELITNGYIKDECFNSRGECYLATHQYEKALTDFEKAIKRNPNNEIYKNNKKIALSKNPTEDYTPSITQSNVIETAFEEKNIKVNLATCSKEDLIKLKAFDESKAETFISMRQAGKQYYDIDSLAQDFNIQPHEIIEIHDKLIFPLKPQAKKGRAIDW